MKQVTTDLRSDTVTRPCAEMRRAMADAEVGDDVFGDDPTVNRLEAALAELSGKEAALLCSSGTQSNLVALLAHCQRGDEYIVGQEAHTYKYEGGGAAVLGSIQPQPIEFEHDSTLDLDKVKANIKADDSHFARTRLLCIENTRSGDVLPFSYHQQAASFCSQHGLALHLDGARLFNAMVSQGAELDAFCRHYDSVSLCISKGLGAPAGSLLVGSRALIAEARKWRKMLGGGMRQAGVLAAACQFALDHNIPRLEEDHRNAQSLATGLANVSGLACDVDKVQTNMVFVTVDNPAQAEPLSAFLAQRGILTIAGPVIRLVTHRDVSPEGIDQLIDACHTFFDKAGAASNLEA